MSTVQTIVAVPGIVRTITVGSRSRADVTHKVTLSCTCEGFQLGGYCYHLSAAAAVLSDDVRYLRARTRARLGR